MKSDDSVWVFGYGSLIWRPDFPYLEKRTAYLPGYERRFWQGSHDHRGTPEAPGRVVTLIPSDGARCIGTAYLLEADTVHQTFEQLDFREKNGYERFEVKLDLEDGSALAALIYIATEDNFAYAGETPLHELAEIIARSSGPSGANKDYLYELANALRSIGAHDPHIYELDALVRALDS